MKTIIKSFSEHGTFVQPETLDYILSKEDPYDFTSFITKNLKEYPLILTIDHIKNLEHEETKKEIVPLDSTSSDEKIIQNKMFSKIFNPERTTQDFDKLNPETELEYDSSDNDEELELKETSEVFDYKPKLTNINKVKGWKPLAREYDEEISIIKDVTGNSVCEGTTSDLNKLFLDRFNCLRKIIRRQRRELANAIPIKRINKSDLNDIQIVGIVKEVRTTNNGHRLIVLEDETDTQACIALKNNHDLINTANEVVLDEIIGLRGKLSKNGDLFVINNIISPDISIQNHRHKADVSVYSAFLSDIHIGSKQFMDAQLSAFIKWINGDIGNSRQRDVAGKIKYLVIPGDIVDGIGIYPNQENELSITDVYHQYEELATQLSLIPDHISIIIQPGNHDAVRPAEPQPAFDKEIQGLFSGNHTTFIANPSYFSLHSVEILSYHGMSLLDFATNIQSLKYNDPVEIMKVMLKKHHLAPTYGGYTPLAPEHNDYMLIDKTPDIFVTGHVHLAQIGEYRGVKLINASSWQSQTSYQKMMNFVPDPAKLPIVDLKSGNVTMMDFNNSF